MMEQKVLTQTKKWFTDIVLGLQLCPFAHKPHQDQSIRYVVCTQHQTEDILEKLEEELKNLSDQDSSIVETTLMILPNAFKEFVDFNDFLYMVNDFLKLQKWSNTFQVASFHPGYQFAHTKINDAENYTNRSPYPIIHILRESSMSMAVDSGIDTALIPEKNIKTMNTLSKTDLNRLFYNINTK